MVDEDYIDIIYGTVIAIPLLSLTFIGGGIAAYSLFDYWEDWCSIS